MSSVAGRGLAVLLFAAVCAPASAAGQAAPKRIEIPRVEAAPTLDEYAGGKGPVA